MAYSAAIKKAAKEQEQRVLVGPDDTNNPESPAFECAAYRDQKDDVVMMREVAGGTKTMRAAGEKYLPKHPMEQPQKYQERVRIAVCHNALGAAVDGITGMIFRKPPVLSEDMDPPIKEAAAKDIDQKGHSLPVFMHYAAKDSLLDGHVWIHVDAPPEGVADTRREERNRGLRPYWIRVLKNQAPNFQYEIRDGKPVITLFTYVEGGTERVGRFGEKQVERRRVLLETTSADGVREIRGELWEREEYEEKRGPSKGQKKMRWRRIDHYPIAATRVPVVFLPAKRNDDGGPFDSEPPLRDLACEQAEHYRVRSDRQKSMTFSSIAVPYAFGKGFLDEDGNPSVAWGSDGMMLSNDPEAKAGVIESQGHGLEATDKELSHIEGRMATLGLQMLVRSGSPQPRGQQPTATSDIMRRAEGEASIVLFADAIEAAANECLELHASYNKQRKATPGTVTINRDFHAQLLSPQHVQVLHEMVATDTLSEETLWALLKQGELLPVDFDADEERAKILAQIERRLATQAEQLEIVGGGPGDEPGDPPRDEAEE